jgi:Tfp pilus assembly protein PilV
MCSVESRSRGSERRRTRGLSLLEALAATAFLGVALLAFANNSVSLTRTAKGADSTAAAHALAQQKLEQLRSLPLGSASLNPGTYSDATTLGADGTNGGQYTRSWTVSANNTPSFGLRTVTVRVSWTDYRTHTTTVAAYVRCSVIPCV